MNSHELNKKLHLDPNLHIIFAVTLMAIMGVASITPAFPLIAQELGVTPKQIGYLITYFTFPGVFLTPVLGVLADRVGRKKILVPSLFLFAVAGTACTFVRDFNLLLGLRFIQGTGAAALAALNVTIMGDLYSGKERTTAMGYNASVLSIGTATYPLAGGALAMLGWYYPFALPITAIPVGLLVLFWLKSPEPKSKQRLGIYFINVWRSVRKLPVIGLLLGGLVTFIVLYGSYLTFFPFLIENAYGGSPLEIGLIMSATSVTTAITTARLGRLARRYSEKSLLTAGYLLFAVSLVLVPYVRTLWLLLIPSAIFGVAAGINITNIISLLAGFARTEQRAAMMSINGMVLRLGQTLGPIVMAGVFGMWDLEGVFFVGALFSLGMFFLAAIMVKQVDEHGA
ncbi:MAG: MFS transporter [Candidatus Latescibacterota bacterium]|nr:MAG: MFS transporter [Candidatus Latescibacterota bacterium]